MGTLSTFASSKTHPRRWGLALVAVLGCSKAERPSATERASAPSAAPASLSRAAPSAREGDRDARGSANPAAAAEDSAEVARVASSGDAASGLRLEKPVDLGPPGAFVVTDRGAIFRTRSDGLVGVRLDAGAIKGRRPDERVEENERARAVPGQVPAITPSSYAYFLSKGRLVRRRFAWDGAENAHPLETLADDALDGTRASAATAGSARREVAVYIARQVKANDERTAKVWVEGAGASPLSSEGSGASSVAIASTGTRAIAVALDERSAMSPVHARTLDLGASGPPRLGLDAVVFVGPSPESHNEVVLAGTDDGPFALIPFARDTASFGLASLFIGPEPRLDAPVKWTMYPNGIEPAPVDAATFCGRTWAAYVRPSGAAADAAKVLVLSSVDARGFGREITAAQGSDFAIVSLAARADGAWLGWVGNGRSWVQGIRCG